MGDSTEDKLTAIEIEIDTISAELQNAIKGNYEPCDARHKIDQFNSLVSAARLLKIDLGYVDVAPVEEVKMPLMWGLI